MSTGVEVLVTGSRCWPLPAPCLIVGSGGDCGDPTGLACVGTHSTNFSPVSACGREYEAESDGDPPHGPGISTLGSQSRVPEESRKGADPSAGGWLAVPGQRRGAGKNCRNGMLSRWLGATGVRLEPAGLCVNEKALNCGAMRA